MRNEVLKRPMKHPVETGDNLQSSRVSDPQHDYLQEFPPLPHSRQLFPLHRLRVFDKASNMNSSADASDSPSSMPEPMKPPPPKRSSKTNLSSELQCFASKLDSMFGGEGANKGVKKPIGGVALFGCSPMPKLLSTKSLEPDLPPEICREETVESKLDSVENGSESIFSPADRAISVEDSPVKFQEINPVSLLGEEAEMEGLDAIIHEIQNKIQDVLHELTRIGAERAALEQRTADKNFTYEVTKREKAALKEGEYETRCLVCNVACHFPCKVQNSKKAECEIMEAGRCKACRCDAAKHFNSPHRFQTSKESKTLKDLKHSHRAQTRRNESLLEILKRKYERSQNEMMDLVLEAHEELCKLEPMSISEYMDILISSENKQTRLGWMDRVRILQETQDRMGMGQASNETADVIKSTDEERVGNRAGNPEVSSGTFQRISLTESSTEPVERVSLPSQVSEQEAFASRAAIDDGLIESKTPPKNSALACKICEEGFRAEGDRVPRLLPCGHTLCHSCLEMLAQRGPTVLCPFDRSAAAIGLEGVYGLKKNFVLLEILDQGLSLLKFNSGSKLKSHGIERAYLASQRKGIFPFSTSKFQYEIHFEKMVQKNKRDMADKIPERIQKGHMPITNVVKSVQKVFKEAEVAMNDKDEEKSFVFYMKGLKIFFENILNTKEYKKNETYFRSMLEKEVKEASDIVCDLEKSLERRYDLLKEGMEVAVRDKRREEEQLKKDHVKRAITLQPQHDGINLDSPVISCHQLKNLFHESSRSFLILDCRAEEDFDASHIKSSRVLSVPDKYLKPGVTCNSLLKTLPEDDGFTFGRRSTVDLLFLMDWFTEDSPTPQSPLQNLYEAIVKWDPGTRYKCTHPMIVKVIEYPDLDTFRPPAETSPEEAPASLLPSKSPLQEVPSRTEPDVGLHRLHGGRVSMESQVLRPLAAPENAEVKQIVKKPPTVNRDLKPGKKMEERIEERGELLEMTREVLRLENEWDQVRLRREKESEEAMRQELQRKEQQLMDRISSMESEKKSLEEKWETQAKENEELRKEMELWRSKATSLEEKREAEKEEEKFRQHEVPKKKMNAGFQRLLHERKAKDFRMKKLQEEGETEKQGNGTHLGNGLGGAFHFNGSKEPSPKARSGEFPLRTGLRAYSSNTGLQGFTPRPASGEPSLKIQSLFSPTVCESPKIQTWTHSVPRPTPTRDGQITKPSLKGPPIAATLEPRVSLPTLQRGGVKVGSLATRPIPAPRNMVKQNLVLVCKICDENFKAVSHRVPRLLPCGHTLCHTCLVVLAKQGTPVLCPFDRSAAEIG
ncbi:unnamed protein product [Darwinula stevensoni]|uniref:RING-type domain-containing protein n=1 Tax=Darwinula stevensoni TaxID=69355 RepID=A0A7R9A4M5_9CRUS|nr:unnamed protein product [Darwinula stevensoni]CAG0892848.1 unnamed protein product [Darwinula stevensoni]